MSHIKLTKKQLFPWVNKDVCKNLKQYCAQYGVTESAAIEAAIDNFLHEAHRSSMTTRITKIEDCVDLIRQQTVVTTELLSLFMKNALVHEAEIDLNQKKRRSLNANEKAQRIEEQILENIHAKMTFIDRMQRQLIGLEKETTV